MLNQPFSLFSTMHGFYISGFSGYIYDSSDIMFVKL